MFTHEDVFAELDVVLEAVKSRGDVANASDVGELQQILLDPRWRALAKVVGAAFRQCVCVCVRACMPVCVRER